MSYKDKAKQREYQRKWCANRRAAFFKGKSCVLCGSSKDLELDHKDPTLKVSHRIWSWSKQRQKEEISKCQVLCNTCHTRKSVSQQNLNGNNNHNSKLTEEIVIKARALRVNLSRNNIRNEFKLRKDHNT